MAAPKKRNAHSSANLREPANTIGTRGSAPPSDQACPPAKCRGPAGFGRGLGSRPRQLQPSGRLQRGAEAGTTDSRRRVSGKILKRFSLHDRDDCMVDDGSVVARLEASALERDWPAGELPAVLLAIVDRDNQWARGTSSKNTSPRIRSLYCLLRLPPDGRPASSVGENKLGERACCGRFKIRSIAAPRRRQTRTSASSISPPLSSQAVPSSAQNTRAARGHASRAFSTRPPSIGSQIRYGSRLAGSGLRATRKRSVIEPILGCL